MAKTFYTEHDIEDMARHGQRSLVIGDEVVLTDLAYESARKLGVELIQPHDTPPGAPIRPYFNQGGALSAPTAGSSVSMVALKERVKSAVRAKLGDKIDDSLVDRIIERVASDLGYK
jgi:hypothetical protein